MNTFKENITDPDFWLRLLYTLLFALAWQVVEVILALLLVLQIGFRLFTGQPHADLAGLGNSLSQYAWQIGRYLSGASEIKPWPFLEWPAADAQWQPRPAEEAVIVSADNANPTPAAPVSSPVVMPQADTDRPAAAVTPVVEPDAPIVHPAADFPEPPLVEPDERMDTFANPEDKPTP